MSMMIVSNRGPRGGVQSLQRPRFVRPVNSWGEGNNGTSTDVIAKQQQPSTTTSTREQYFSSSSSAAIRAQAQRIIDDVDKSKVKGSGSSHHHDEPVAYSRRDLWLAMATAQIIFIGSIVVSSSSLSYDGTTSSKPSRSGGEVAVLTLSSISFTLSFLVGVSYFHGPFRRYLTTLETLPPNYMGVNIREVMTVEQLLSMLVLTFVCIASGLTLGTDNTSVVDSTAVVWNANVFYSSWTCLYVAAYLGITVTVGSIGHSIKLWLMVLFSSICASAALLLVYSGSTCQAGEVLSQTDYCSLSLTGGLLAVFSAIVSFVCGAYLLYCIRSKSNRGWSKSRSRWMGLLPASILLVMHSVTVALVSSPSGPGHEVGNVFVATWMTFILGVLLWKSCVEGLLSWSSPTAVTVKSVERRLYKPRRTSFGEDTHIDTDVESESEEMAYIEDARSDISGASSVSHHEELVHYIEPLPVASRDDGEMHGQLLRPDPADEQVVREKHRQAFAKEPSEEGGGSSGRSSKSSIKRLQDHAYYHSDSGSGRSSSQSNREVPSLDESANGDDHREPLHRSQRQEPSPAKNSSPPGGRDADAPLQREPSQHVSTPSEMTPEIIDQEWNFYTLSPQEQTKVMMTMVPTATADKTSAAGYSRKSSYGSLMSDLAPLEEASNESTSPKSKSGNGSSTKAVLSASPSKRNKSNSSSRRGKGKARTPPPPPSRHPDRDKTNQAGEGPDDNNKPSYEANSLVSSCSSDFEIVVDPGDSSASGITELTDTFDVSSTGKKHHNSSGGRRGSPLNLSDAAIAVAAARHAEALSSSQDLALKNSYKPRSSSLKRTSPSSQLQPAFPERLPLYNGPGDVSNPSASNGTKSPSNSSGEEEGLQELPRHSFGHLQTNSDDFKKYQPRRQQRHRKSGGISTGSNRSHGKGNKKTTKRHSSTSTTKDVTDSDLASPKSEPDLLHTTATLPQTEKTRAKSPGELLDTILGRSHLSKSSKPRSDKSRESMQSNYSGDLTAPSALGEDYAC